MDKGGENKAEIKQRVAEVPTSHSKRIQKPSETLKSVEVKKKTKKQKRDMTLHEQKACREDAGTTEQTDEQQIVTTTIDETRGK